MTRRQLLEQAFQAHGIEDAARLESHLRACDLSRPASRITLRRGARFQVWVRIGGVPGKYGAPEGEDPARLGIMIEGREGSATAHHRSLHRGLVSSGSARPGRR